MTRLDDLSHLPPKNFLQAFYQELNQLAEFYQQEDFAKETIICQFVFTFKIEKRVPTPYLAEIKFVQLGEKYLDPDDNRVDLSHVRYLETAFNFEKRKLTYSQGWYFDLDIYTLNEINDVEGVQGCTSSSSVQGKPWESYDPYQVLAKANVLGGSAYVAEHCSEKTCYARIHPDGDVDYSLLLFSPYGLLNNSEAKEKRIETGIYFPIPEE